MGIYLIKNTTFVGERFLLYGENIRDTTDNSFIFNAYEYDFLDSNGICDISIFYRFLNQINEEYKSYMKEVYQFVG